MYQSFITRSGHNGWLEVVSLNSWQYSNVVNGSILIVPSGTVAFVSIDGEQLSRPYHPGRYEIFNGVDPFFVRLRNALMHGNPATTISVFFVSVNKTKFVSILTDKILFNENRFNIPMTAEARCNLSISIADPLKVVSKLVGTYCDSCREEDVDPCINQTIRSPIMNILASALSKLTVEQFNQNLSRISESAYPLLKIRLREYGINLEMFDVTVIDIPASDMSRYKEKADKYADGIIAVNLEKKEIDTVYDGDIGKRSIVDIATGTRTGGPATAPNQFTSPHGGGMNGMMPALTQMMCLSRMLPNLNEAVNMATPHTDMFRNARSDSQGSTSSADSPPPIPGRTKRCPSCNGNVIRSSEVCPICGYRF